MAPGAMAFLWGGGGSLDIWLAWWWARHLAPGLELLPAERRAARKARQAGLEHAPGGCESACLDLHSCDTPFGALRSHLQRHCPASSC